MATPVDRDSIRTLSQWIRLIGGVAVVFALFHWSARALGSDRGQAGLIVGLLVVTATLAVERVIFGQTLAHAARSVGLGRPTPLGMAMAAIVSLALVLIVPLVSRIVHAPATLLTGWWWLVPGLFAQAGIAEEVLFRGFLFGRLRRGRSFWRAAWLSILPFAAVHLVLFATMPWPIALAALLLSIILSIPLAHLFELAGGTIWAPALLHCVVQGTAKVVAFPDTTGAVFPLVWMAGSAVLPLLFLAVSRPRSAGA